MPRPATAVMKPGAWSDGTMAHLPLSAEVKFHQHLVRSRDRHARRALAAHHGVVERLPLVLELRVGTRGEGDERDA